MRENPSKEMWLLLTLGSVAWFIRWRIKQAERALLSKGQVIQTREQREAEQRAAIAAAYYEEHGGALPGPQMPTEAEMETAQINAYLDVIGGEGTGESILAALGGDW